MKMIFIILPGHSAVGTVSQALFIHVLQTQTILVLQTGYNV